MKEGIKHLDHVLKKLRFGTAMIIRGSSLDEQRNALVRFNTDPHCSVFLLHASTAAAGLTLTAATHAFFLEPFTCKEEENQAMARIHRIGQTKNVISTTLYMRSSIEERMLALRRQGGGGGRQAEGDSLALLVDEETKNDSAAATEEDLLFLLGSSHMQQNVRSGRNRKCMIRVEQTN